MADRQSNTPDTIVAQNGKKTLIKKIAFTTSAARTDLTTTTLDGKQSVPVGALIMIQADQDFYYNVVPAGATTSVTKLSGANPGTLVAMKVQEFTYLGVQGNTGPNAYDFALDIIGDTAAGTVAVFLVG